MSKHEQNVSLLMEKIEDADAICVGAASGLSAAGGHTFYYQRDKLFVEIFGAYEKNMGIITPLMGFTIAIKARRSGGAFWHNPCILSFMKSHSSPTKT